MNWLTRGVNIARPWVGKLAGFGKKAFGIGKTGAAAAVGVGAGVAAGRTTNPGSSAPRSSASGSAAGCTGLACFSEILGRMTTLLLVGAVVYVGFIIFDGGK